MDNIRAADITDSVRRDDVCMLAAAASDLLLAHLLCSLPTLQTVAGSQEVFSGNFTHTDSSYSYK